MCISFLWWDADPLILLVLLFNRDEALESRCGANDANPGEAGLAWEPAPALDLDARMCASADEASCMAHCWRVSNCAGTCSAHVITDRLWQTRTQAPAWPCMAPHKCSLTVYMLRRPATHPAWQAGSVFAPLDQVAGGTWIGVAESGKFGLLTNYREPKVRPRTDLAAPAAHATFAPRPYRLAHRVSAPAALLRRRRRCSQTVPQSQTCPSGARRTRGEILQQYLTSDSHPADFARRLEHDADVYAGYNVICGDAAQEALVHYSNRDGAPPVTLTPGLHALSNGDMREDWPKMRRGKEQLLPVLRSIGESGAHAQAPASVLAITGPVR